MLRDYQDAYGHMLKDYLDGKGGWEIVESSVGYFSVSGGPEQYFSEYDDWADHDKEAMKYVQGRVLDVGCAAGRHSLYLQERGFEVVGIDDSPLAVEVCRKRGLRDVRAMSLMQVSKAMGEFDTVLCLGGSFSYMFARKRIGWLLKKIYGLTTREGRIVARIRNPYVTVLPEFLELHELNRQQGKMAGEMRLRIRYKRYVTPWIDYFMLSPEELEDFLAENGWRIEYLNEGDDGLYLAIMEKEYEP